MNGDLRNSELYLEAQAIYEATRRPGSGAISDAADLDVAGDGASAVFSAVIVDALEGTPPTRICCIDLQSADIRVLTSGPNNDRSPKISPDGRTIAFLSDRQRAGDFQLYLLDSVSGDARATPPVAGWIEYLQWSPDGTSVLLGVAAHGADTAGAQGAVTTDRRCASSPSWMPNVHSGADTHQWRSVWVYDVNANSARQVPDQTLNVWEASWCGPNLIALVASKGSGEGLWYSAALYLIDVTAGTTRTIHVPQDQIGWPTATATGERLAFVEAVCSDRWIVAGQLKLVHVMSGELQTVPTNDIDVTHVEWRSESRLLVAGHRGLDTAVGLYDVTSRTFGEIWSSRELTASGRYARVAGFGATGDCALVAEGFSRAPEIGVIVAGSYRSVRSFDLDDGSQYEAVGAVKSLEWAARDGLTIQGWLIKPLGPKDRCPLIMQLHGGPVGLWRPTWLGRGGVATLMLLRRGFAVFMPNPRGSSGRGQGFARCVVGDMGGADAQDCLSGIDYLCDLGIADPNRLGVTGGSYGGFMTSWLITQEARFSAAVPVAPVTNHVTEYLLSNIPQFTALFMGHDYCDRNSDYFSRSPIMYAKSVRTPTLHICGALDRSTPAVEAAQFHSALIRNGVASVLVTYPDEGHGVRKFPALIDYAARTVSWFTEHIECGEPLDPRS